MSVRAQRRLTFTFRLPYVTMSRVVSNKTKTRTASKGK